MSALDEIKNKFTQNNFGTTTDLEECVLLMATRYPAVSEKAADQLSAMQARIQELEEDTVRDGYILMEAMKLLGLDVSGTPIDAIIGAIINLKKAAK